ncbi:VOC family protein [Leucobacter iarius]|uniref:VOC family protein n=1 Tax=Leucobacter iarius TaxID=333963 RepID=A0ABP4XPT3_9MICO
MALHWKLVIDCRDPHILADFWAGALEYAVEDPGVLVAHLLAAGQLPEAATTEHGGSRRFATLAAIRHPDDAFDPFSGTGQGRRILFQRVPEEKQGKNRLHLDVHAGEPGLDVLLGRLESLGAVRVTEVDRGPAGHWWVMRDPEGNEFCAAG